MTIESPEICGSAVVCSAWLGRICCWLGLHNWDVLDFSPVPLIGRGCRRCDKCQTLETIHHAGSFDGAAWTEEKWIDCELLTEAEKQNIAKTAFDAFERERAALRPNE